ncbi:HAMP domain-containing protein [Phaeovibrio sulfidiphilus]|uniref:histidine kinase n=1 Tax=Phaeovibrio sulfidiphilus TaxID=1220600 RepID=A0A8J6Z046_9PROT|nr:ATP-binding protein [Phaeovibrio sulfidiphilus]MBE1237583.1 HAMP domain-containing protein [Phaeovibrio sulfidiphilus]
MAPSPPPSPPDSAAPPPSPPHSPAPSLRRRATEALRQLRRVYARLFSPAGRGFRAIMPKSLMGRSLLIIVTPLVLLQVATAQFFFDRHWETMSMRLNSSVAAEVALVADTLQRTDDPKIRAELFNLAGVHLQMGIRILPPGSERVKPYKNPTGALTEDAYVVRTLTQALDAALGERGTVPYYVGVLNDKTLVLYLELPDDLVEILIPRKRLFSSTVYVFIVWMIVSSLVLFSVAWLFMRNQIRPISRLASAADALGKGLDVDDFPNRGALEVRKAGTAFIRMRDRIRRQITQRTEMLAGVSHDLRTPLTRMRLQLAFMEENEGARELEEDIAEMERLIQGYLAFAQSDALEDSEPVDLVALAESIAAKVRRAGGEIEVHAPGPVVLTLKPHATERCLSNVIGNAVRYGTKASVRVGLRGRHAEVLVDDDGPGIPPDRREEVFRPFVRLEGSRNPKTGGTGLGLTIARDSARSMGGDILLESSPPGGLRARIRFPL